MGTRLFIPACGDKLVLTAPWRFTLYFEHRNKKFAQSVGLLSPEDVKGWGDLYEGEPYRSALRSAGTSLPEGTVLECDRIYIRQYNKSRMEEANDYDSVTWKVERPRGKEGKGKPHGRFWVKLPDVYSIEYELRHDSLYRDRVKSVKQVMES